MKVKNDKTVTKSEEFVAPDGGWGWVILVAAGCINLTTFPVMQQFGLLFRDRMAILGIDKTEIASVINYNSAATSCMGLANGPMFRKLSFRQVSFIGSIFISIGLILTLFSNGFLMYIMSFSILLGIGVGMTASATSIALNTYFDKRRRIATGLSWTITGFGPIIWPQVIAVLIAFYGDRGALLILIGLAIQSFIFALLLQPVEWHIKPHNEDSEHELIDDPKKMQGIPRIGTEIFSSQYLYNEDDPHMRGYEIIEPGFPMMSRGNDGYFTATAKSRNSLMSRSNSTTHTSQLNLTFSRNPSIANITEKKDRKKSFGVTSNKNSFTNAADLLQDDIKSKFIPKALDNKIAESDGETCPILIASHLHECELDAKHLKEVTMSRRVSVRSYKPYPQINHTNSMISLVDNNDWQNAKPMKPKSRRKSSNTFNMENELLRETSSRLEKYLENKETEIYDEWKVIKSAEDSEELKEEIDENKKENLSFLQKVTLFFDLDLLKDYTYVNLMVGITISNFSEINFSILTPFILGDFGMTRSQVAMFMSILAAFDMSVRFVIPFIAGKIGLENKWFFLFGVMGMAMGRVVLAHCQQFEVTLAVAAWIGMNKGLRTIFIALVIPSHVSLDKLPGASGLQLVFAGIFFLAAGPIVGKIQDATSLPVTLHCLNITTYITAICWGYEHFRTIRHASTESLTPTPS